MAIDALLSRLFEQDDLTTLPRSGPVTPTAIQQCMRPVERKRRPTVVERLDPERINAVAKLALRVPAGHGCLPPRGIVDVTVAGGAPVRERPKAHRLTVPTRKAPALQLVAFRAGDRGMPTQELEAGILVVIEVEHLSPKTRRPMTGAAITRELTHMGISVAGNTQRIQRFVANGLRQAARKLAFLGPMATGAVNLNVLPGERIRRVLVVTGPSPKTVHGMAIATVGVELPPMCVVLVTVSATAKRHVPETLAHVALRARQADVSTPKRVSSSLVIESADSPRARAMTTLAIGPQRGLMLIAVAAHTAIETNPLPLLIRMAALTFHPLMSSLQPKGRSRVIESNRLELDFWGMAPLTVRAQPPSVNVGVAGNASRVVQQESDRLRACRGIGRFMTLLTVLDRAVQTHQRVTSLCVVELVRIPSQNLKILPLVLLMTAHAVIKLVLMEPSPGTAALGEILVTVEAFVRLDSSAWRMARHAVRQSGELRVNMAQRPRRDERVQFLRLGHGG